MNVNVFDLYKTLRQNDILFCFSGSISQSTVEGLGHTLRTHLERQEASSKATRNVFAILVEQMQNVINYSQENIPGPRTEGSLSYGIILVGQDNGEFFIISGNYISESAAGRVSFLLDKMQNMGKEELKTFYRQERRRETDPESKGAGLGLIEVARKASLPVEHTIMDTEDGRTFLTIKAVIREPS